MRTTALILTLTLAAGLAGCRGVSRTIGTSGAVEVSASEFIARYEQPKRSDKYWAYIGRVGGYHYMERYEPVAELYPELVGEIRTTHAGLPAGFPVVPQGRPYPDDPPPPEPGAPGVPE
jgi:hypothetical protein